MTASDQCISEYLEIFPLKYFRVTLFGSPQIYWNQIYPFCGGYIFSDNNRSPDTCVAANLSAIDERIVMAATTEINLANVKKALKQIFGETTGNQKVRDENKDRASISRQWSRRRTVPRRSSQ